MKTDKISRFSISIKNDKGVFIYSQLSNKAIFLKSEDEDVVDRLRENPEAMRFAKKNGIVTGLSEKDENKFVFDLFGIAIREDKRPVSIAIVPTTTCNFDCKYCYEKEFDYPVENYSRTMSKSDIRNVISYISDNEIKQFVLYGGEPLQAENFFLIEPLLVYAVEKKIDIYAVTNAFDLEAYSDFLGKPGIGGAQITIDGLAESHNLSRPYIGGGGTWDKIISNVDLCVTKGVRVDLRMNIADSNYHSCLELKEYVKNRWDGKVFCEGFLVTGKTSENSYETVGGEIQKNISHPIVKRLQMLDSMSLTAVESPGFCPARTKTGMLLIGPQAIWSCWNHVGDYSKSIGNPSRVLENVKPADFSDHRSECISCKWFPVCQGMCLDSPGKSCASVGEFVVPYLSDYLLSKGAKHVYCVES